MKKKTTNIFKELIKNKNFLLVEFKRLILKSILQNKKLSLKKRGFCYNKLNNLFLKQKISVQKGVCFTNGKFKSRINQFSTCRQITKQNLNNLKYNNIKKKTW